MLLTFSLRENFVPIQRFLFLYDLFVFRSFRGFRVFRVFRFRLSIPGVSIFQPTEIVWHVIPCHPVHNYHLTTDDTFPSRYPTVRECETATRSFSECWILRDFSLISWERILFPLHLLETGTAFSLDRFEFLNIHVSSWRSRHSTKRSTNAEQSKQLSSPVTRYVDNKYRVF